MFSFPREVALVEPATEGAPVRSEVCVPGWACRGQQCPHKPLSQGPDRLKACAHRATEQPSLGSHTCWLVSEPFMNLFTRQLPSLLPVLTEKTLSWTFMEHTVPERLPGQK